MLGPVAREQKPLDGAVRKTEHVGSWDTGLLKHAHGVFGHELVAQRSCAARRTALGARVKREGGTAAADEGVDDSSEYAVLLAVAVQHEHRRGRGVDAVGAQRVIRSWCVEKRRQAGSVGCHDMQRARQVGPRPPVRPADVQRRQLKHRLSLLFLQSMFASRTILVRRAVSRASVRKTSRAAY